MDPIIPFDNTYARLPERFYSRLNPTPVRAPRLIKVNGDLARLLGIDPDALDAEVLAGNRVPQGAEPLAEAYAGHQFGHFVPQLGDGRALLLGEVVGRDGRRRDIQFKGSGPTPYSRMGDGRAALGPVLREYIVSEAMAALGIPTTRTLGAVMTGEPVMREAILPGAVLTRVAASHIRVGTFQYFAARQDLEAVQLLADYCIARHDPAAAQDANPYAAFLAGMAKRQAQLVARWLGVGFIHGVMNTDNCAISGETIDFGPCAFMDAYDPSAVFSSIDHAGRYAYGNQPRMAQWNVARLAECLLPLLGSDDDAAMQAAKDSLAAFAPAFQTAYDDVLQAKIGLATRQDGDDALVRDLLQLMAEDGADFTRTFRALCSAADKDDGVMDEFVRRDAAQAWLGRWRDRLRAEAAAPESRAAAMRNVNPAVIPRNHRIEEVIHAAVERQDFAPFETLMTVLSMPFVDDPAYAAYQQAPIEAEKVRQTFCGT